MEILLKIVIKGKVIFCEKNPHFGLREISSGKKRFKFFYSGPKSFRLAFDVKDAVHQASLHPVSSVGIVSRKCHRSTDVKVSKELSSFHRVSVLRHCVIEKCRFCHWRDAIKCHHLFVINLSSSVIIVISERRRLIIECHHCHLRVSLLSSPSVIDLSSSVIIVISECHRLIIECRYCHYSNVINVSSFERNHWKWQPNWKASSMELVKTSLSF